MQLNPYEQAKKEMYIETHLKPNCNLKDILGEEEYKKIKEKLSDTDSTLDGIIDYLHGHKLLLQSENNERNKAEIIKTAIQLNKIERCINWEQGKAYPTTNTGYINNLGNIGDLYKTRGINESEEESTAFKNEIAVILQSYLLCDWGDLTQEDKELNDMAVNLPNSDRILAKYNTSKGDIYIITECDRSRTTILFTNEY